MAAVEICGYAPHVAGMSNTPEGVFARGGDTKKQRQLRFAASISFRTGVERAIRYFDRRAAA